jgi:voltage-gated potassium channel
MTTQTAPADERWGALHDLDAWLRTPMLVLSFVWLILVLEELTWERRICWKLLTW